MKLGLIASTPITNLELAQHGKTIKKVIKLWVLETKDNDDDDRIIFKVPERFDLHKCFEKWMQGEDDTPFSKDLEVGYKHRLFRSDGLESDSIWFTPWDVQFEGEF